MDESIAQVEFTFGLRDLTLGRLRKALPELCADCDVQPALETIFKRIMGSHDQGLLLERVLYWAQKKAADGDDEFYATASRWEKEIEVSRATVTRAKSTLKAFVDIETKPSATGRVDHYRLQLQKFLQKFADALGVVIERVIAALRRVIDAERAAAAELAELRAFREGVASQSGDGSHQKDTGVASQSGDGSPQFGATGRITKTHNTESIYTDSNSGSKPESPPPSRVGVAFGFPPHPAKTFSSSEEDAAALREMFPDGDVKAAIELTRRKLLAGEVREGFGYAVGVLRGWGEQKRTTATGEGGGIAGSREAFVMG